MTIQRLSYDKMIRKIFKFVIIVTKFFWPDFRFHDKQINKNFNNV
jgi:hypothetical protein